ncbi:hypothetical protein LJ737_22425, partial [Hymenobacter sp. 15J16-1T3B]|uniref:hypothetical protein n=1 Tax=Hymenobacter sp. 15J16-1T3B TaxID=2886941 RepID=UPI001D119AFA
NSLLSLQVPAASFFSRRLSSPAVSKRNGGQRSERLGFRVKSRGQLFLAARVSCRFLLNRGAKVAHPISESQEQLKKSLLLFG